MSGNLEQLDPNYVVSFEYSKDNVAKLVSEFQNHGLQTVTRPGHNSKTVYAFTRVDEPGVFESGETFSEKPSSKQQPSKGEKASSNSNIGADAGVSDHDDQQPARSTASGVDRDAGNTEKQELAGREKSASSSASDKFADIPGDKKKQQGLLSKAEDAAQSQGGVQGLKDKAGKVPGADKAEDGLKKKVPGGDKLGGIAGAAGGLAGGGSGGGSGSGSGSGSGVGTGAGAGAGKKGVADQAKGGLKGFNKDDLVKGGKEVFDGHKDELTQAGQQAAKGDTSGLEKAGTNVGKDVVGRVDKDQLVSSGKKVFSGDKKDMLKNGKKALAKNQAENKGKDLLSGAGGVGAAGGLAGKTGDGNSAKDSQSKGTKSGEFENSVKGASSGDKPTENGSKKDTEPQSFEDDVPGGTEGSLRSDAAVKGFPRESSASPLPREEKSASSFSQSDPASKNSFTGAATKESATSSPASSGGGRATLFAIVANFDFVHSVTPIYDAERRKKLDSTVSNLIQAPTLTPTDHDLTNLEHLTRNPREILYFFYFKNYILWLLPISLVGVICRFFSRAVAPWEFNITYTFLLIVWSLLFTASWIYYFEPLYAKRLGKVLGVGTPGEKKLSAPHVVLYKKFAFIPVALLFAASLIVFQFLCFFIEIFITQLYSGPFSAILALLPTVLISAIVPVLTLIYNKLFVDPLVKWENGPNPKKSKTEKNYILTFLTSYVPLFITLFVYLPLGHKFTPDLQGGVVSYAKKYHIPVAASEFIVDINRYKKQFFYYTVTAQIINMALDNVVPLLLDALVPSLVKDGNRSQGDVLAKIDSVVQSRYPQDFDLWKKVQLFHASNYGEFDLDQNYGKLVVQFGYIAMFSIIWPLAPLIFTIIDLAIFRADLWRAFIKSKPSSNPTDLQVAKGGAHKIHVSSAPWNGILEKTTYLGFVVSVTLLLMYRHSNFPGIGLSTGLEKRDNWYRESPLVFSWSNILLAAAIAEHLALFGYLYVKDVCLSYQTKFEPATLPYVEVQAKPVYNEEVDETAAVMEEVAYEPIEQPKPKGEETQKEGITDRDAALDNSDNTFGAKSTGAEVYGDSGYSYGYDGGYAPSGDRSAVEGVADDGRTRAAGYDDGYRAGYAKGFEGGDEDDGFADNGIAANGFDGRYGKPTSSSGSKRKGYGKFDDNDYLNDNATTGATNGLGGSASSGATRSGNKTHDSGVSGSRSSKKTTSPSDKASKESSRHATSAKESNLSAQGNGKGSPAPHANSGSKENPVQSQGKSDLTSASASKNSKTSGIAGAGAGAGAGGVAGAVGGAGIADSYRAPSSTKHHSNRESSYLESPTPSEDAGATLPDTIPTSKNYDSRNDKNGNPVKSAAQSEASPSASYSGDGAAAGGTAGGAAGGLGGLAAGAAGDLKSGKVPKGSGDVGKDLQKDVGSDLKSGKLPKGGDIGKDLKKDIPKDPKDLKKDIPKDPKDLKKDIPKDPKDLKKDIPKDLPKDIGSGLPSGGESQAGGENTASGAFGEAAQQGGKESGKAPSVGDAMKTLDPAAVAGSVGNIAKDPSAAPQEAGNLAQQGAPVVSAAWANRSKGAKGLSSQGAEESAAGASKHDSSRSAADIGKGARGVADDEGYGAGAAQGGKYASGYDVKEGANIESGKHNASRTGTSGVKKSTDIEDGRVYNAKENIDNTYASGSTGAAHGTSGAEQPIHGKGVHGTGNGREAGHGGVGGADPESPAAQQFGRDVHSLKSGKTYGTAESKIDNLTGAADQSEGTGAAGTAGVSGADANIQKTPQRSATKPKTDGTRSKTGTPSRSKTIGHSSQAKKEAANPKATNTTEASKSASKDPKQRSSNPELRANQANSTPESKGKHKSGLLHKIIKKLE
ncbi:hypothetical protein ZYGR_0AZ00950 [Zygosaccharomyces rouxii]|uniref:Anoctamin transmembrane domain-containing protein n=1 Tax=Zygosaccharomyces rouxii TaxID=4956 RepID=A0A1Q3AJM6_ZYGRO|nr:hypothetical protein ZYGR_0AZ00950 [Zygosaccharomyces rouxii]